MRRHFFTGCLIFISLILTACVFYSPPQQLPVPPEENWSHQIEGNTTYWMRGADAWFVKGNPNSKQMTSGVYGKPLVTRKTKTAPFTGLKVNGDFQIRIVGGIKHHEIIMHGPANAVAQITMRRVGDTLIIEQPKHAPINMSYVVIRIDMKRLNHLEQWGRGRIEGIHLEGDTTIFSTGSGNIYLSGCMHLRNIQNFGQGNVNIFGAETPLLDIQTHGTGVTNVCGNIGIRSIFQRGASSINIMGANSDSLRIYANGTGKVGVNGFVNLCEVKAYKLARVYVNKVRSGCLSIVAKQNSRVGVGGVANNVHIYAEDAAIVSAMTLCGDSVYVRTTRKAHANVNATEKIYADATGNSSIYFFGRPAILTPFINGYGTVVAMRKSD